MSMRNKVGRPPKATAHFVFLKQKSFPYQTVRLCVSYNHKRLYWSDSGGYLFGIDLTQFKNDGTLNLKSEPTNIPNYAKISERIRENAKIGIFIVEDACRRGLWEFMTSCDLSTLMYYLKELRQTSDCEERETLNQMYERHWLHIKQTNNG